MDVLYWEAGDDAASQAFDGGSTSLPAFCYYGYERRDYFGHPAYEYPGLVKVHIYISSCTVMLYVLYTFQGIHYHAIPVDMPVCHWPNSRSGQERCGPRVSQHSRCSCIYSETF